MCVISYTAHIGAVANKARKKKRLKKIEKYTTTDLYTKQVCSGNCANAFSNKIIEIILLKLINCSFDATINGKIMLHFTVYPTNVNFFLLNIYLLRSVLFCLFLFFIIWFSSYFLIIFTCILNELLLRTMFCTYFRLNYSVVGTTSKHITKVKWLVKCSVYETVENRNKAVDYFVAENMCFFNMYQHTNTIFVIILWALCYCCCLQYRTYIHSFHFLHTFIRNDVCYIFWQICFHKHTWILGTVSEYQIKLLMLYVCFVCGVYITNENMVGETILW